MAWPSLRHDLLVAQDQPRIDHYQRADEGWRLESVAGTDTSNAAVVLQSGQPLRLKVLQVRAERRGEAVDPLSLLL